MTAADIDPLTVVAVVVRAACWIVRRRTAITKMTRCPHRTSWVSSTTRPP